MPLGKAPEAQCIAGIAESAVSRNDPKKSGFLPYGVKSSQAFVIPRSDE
jgi:hypothetical protein